MSTSVMNYEPIGLSQPFETPSIRVPRSTSSRYHSNANMRKSPTVKGSSKLEDINPAFALDTTTPSMSGVSSAAGLESGGKIGLRLPSLDTPFRRQIFAPQDSEPMTPANSVGSDNRGRDRVRAQRASAAKQGEVLRKKRVGTNIRRTANRSRSNNIPVKLTVGMWVRFRTGLPDEKLRAHLGQPAKIIKTPVHPSTWYTLARPDFPKISSRRPCFDVLPLVRVLETEQVQASQPQLAGAKVFLVQPGEEPDTYTVLVKTTEAQVDLPAAWLDMDSKTTQALALSMMPKETVPAEPRLSTPRDPTRNRVRGSGGRSARKPSDPETETDNSADESDVEHAQDREPDRYDDDDIEDVEEEPLVVEIEDDARDFVVDEHMAQLNALSRGFNLEVKANGTFTDLESPSLHRLDASGSSSFSLSDVSASPSPSYLSPSPSPSPELFTEPGFPEDTVAIVAMGLSSGATSDWEDDDAARTLDTAYARRPLVAEDVDDDVDALRQWQFSANPSSDHFSETDGTDTNSHLPAGAMRPISDSSRLPSHESIGHEQLPQPHGASESGHHQHLSQSAPAVHQLHAHSGSSSQLPQSSIHQTNGHAQLPPQPGPPQTLHEEHHSQQAEHISEPHFQQQGEPLTGSQDTDIASYLQDITAAAASASTSSPSSDSTSTEWNIPSQGVEQSFHQSGSNEAFYNNATQQYQQQQPESYPQAETYADISQAQWTHSKEGLNNVDASFMNASSNLQKRKSQDISRRVVYRCRKEVSDMRPTLGGGFQGSGDEQLEVEEQIVLEEYHPDRADRGDARTPIDQLSQPSSVAASPISSDESSAQYLKLKRRKLEASPPPPLSPNSSFAPSPAPLSYDMIMV